MFIPILVAIATALLATGAELLHTGRVKKVRYLAFGPDGRFSALSILAPILRILFLGSLTWALTTLFLLEPKAHRAEVKTVEPKERRHLLLVLDVSPSMKLQDSGEDSGLSRTERASGLVQSLLKRTTDDKLHITMVAVYNGAKPVVQESRDPEVILNFLDGMDMSSVFPVGKTRLFDGLEEAAKIAKDWPPNSATLLLVSDGDTVPATGMPKMPPAIDGVLVMGVGNPTKGSMIDGRQSRQDVGALQQIATRLGGHYHDGNARHVPTSILNDLGSLKTNEDGLKLTLREYALIIGVTSALALALLPIFLYFFASPFKPGSDTHSNSSKTAA
ncbi:MAG: Ca-activated chloride channel family protein [Akkermansiaceae bacterium]|jgi:Ca-activated chloride channel family protein